MKKSRSRHPIYLTKRGGSSGGASTSGNSDASSTPAPVFSRATPEEISRIRDWESEFDQMEEAMQGAPNKYSKTDMDLLGDSVYIADAVHSAFVNGDAKVLGVKDAKGNIQAAAVYDRMNNHVYIEYLATAPWNFSNDSRAIKGAGTKAIIETIKMEKASNRPAEIRLYALDRAVPFYEKLGFKPYKGNKHDLKLSAEDANKLLEKFGEL